MEAFGGDLEVGGFEGLGGGGLKGLEGLDRVGLAEFLEL